MIGDPIGVEAINNGTKVIRAADGIDGWACGHHRVHQPDAEPGHALAVCCAVGVDDGLEFVGGGAVHDHRVGAVVQFLANTVDALLRRSGGRRLQPLVGDQRGDVLDLLRGRLVVDSAGNRGDDGVLAELCSTAGSQLLVVTIKSP